MNLYPTLLIIEFVSAVLVFFALFKFVAPYGRHASQPQKPQNSNILSKAHISPRPAWLIMEIPALLTLPLVFLYYTLVSTPPIPTHRIIALLLWVFHYTYRTLIFPFLGSKGTKTFPLWVALGGAGFNIMNGYINGWALLFSPPNWNAPLPGSPLFIIGITLFFAGFITHLISDRELRLLKKRNNGAYGIPTAFLHKYVTSPNYLGEIIMWTGFFILTLTPAALAFTIFTIANLFPRAYKHRQWYKTTFPDYPKKRKILIPHIL